MYETESDNVRDSRNQIPQEVWHQFETDLPAITHRSLLRWSEHCTECALPDCYRTCELYEPRRDGKCRRFVDGMVRIDQSPGLAPYLLKIRFKRWGKLWAVGIPHLFPLQSAQRQERMDLLYSGFLATLPLPRKYKRKVTQGHYNRKKEEARNLPPDGELPSYFMLECFNPNEFSVDLTISVFPWRAPAETPFQRKVAVEPGFNRHRISGSDIFSVVPADRPLNFEIIPNDIAEGTCLIFGFMDFVRDENWRDLSICKCVVWDLDNTLWDGILVEDGPDGIRPREEVLDVIKQLDKRGIIQSVASKNDKEYALKVLEDLGIEEYFLFPQISWDPKGIAVKRIADSLNIGLDTIIFIDDSPFERAEVSDFCPDVFVLDASEARTLPDRKACQGSASSESSKRRQLYRNQQTRLDAERSFEGSYLAFLESCQIRVRIEALTPENVERAYELAQRTNQMNFSGNRYSKEELVELLENKECDTYTITCEDRHGSYGVIGLCIVNSSIPEMTDLMFSCRVQSKRVEHSLMTWLLRRYSESSSHDFFASIKLTERNAPARKVFDDFGFEVAQEGDGFQRLMFRKDKQIPDDAIIETELVT